MQKKVSKIFIKTSIDFILPVKVCDFFHSRKMSKKTSLNNPQIEKLASIKFDRCNYSRCYAFEHLPSHFPHDLHDGKALVSGKILKGMTGWVNSYRRIKTIRSVFYKSDKQDELLSPTIFDRGAQSKGILHLQKAIDGAVVLKQIFTGSKE